MKKYINIYLDESGNSLSTFFSIGGFFIVSDDFNNIRKIERSIVENIKRTEMNIKRFRKNNEKNLIQFINNNKIDLEVKWNRLSLSNKSYLFDNLNFLGQNNVSITCNLKKWISKYDKQINLDAICNMMTFHLIDKIINNLNFDVHDELIIKLNIDQRKQVPNIKDFNIAGKSDKKFYKLDGLQEYLNTQLYTQSKYKYITLLVKQFNSASSPLIRYADYFVGLIAASCRYISGQGKEHDMNSLKLLSICHKKFPCNCYSEIKNQCEFIDLMIKDCTKHK